MKKESSLQEMVHHKLAQFLEKSEDYELTDLYTIVMAEVERPLIELILQRSRGNQLQAARMLGINRNTLRKKIHNLGIDKKSHRKIRRKI